MRWRRALPLPICAAAAVALISGGSGADPSTPDGRPGLGEPFVGTAVIGSGGVLGAVDPYGSLVDLRLPGPTGKAGIDNSFERQVAGTVPPDTGVVIAAAAAGAPRPMWQATSLRQRYLGQSNVLRTRGRAAGASVLIEDAAGADAIARRVSVRGEFGQRVSLRLGLHLDAGLRCRVGRHGESRPASSGPSRTLQWHGRGVLRVDLSCSLAGRPPPPGRLVATAAAADRRWLLASRPLPGAPPWARRLYARSLLVLRALTDRRSGAVAAGARDHWAYVWPRDAAAASIALAESGHRALARRVVGFLRRLDLEAGARFRGDGSAVADGRELPGDSAGWVRAAALASGGSAPRRAPGAWRARGDYGERRDDSGDYLANAIAGGASAEVIGRLFGGPAGLHRRASDPRSGIDSAAAWAVRPFPRPQLFGAVRRSLLPLAAGPGRFGIAPAEDWPREEQWTAPAAWSAWSLAALGERAAAMRLLGMLRRASTSAGALPERVGPGGVPLSTTPLGWSHAFALLALRQLYAR